LRLRGRGKLQDQIESIWREDKMIAVLVTNDVDKALLLADRISPLNPGPRARKDMNRVACACAVQLIPLHGSLTMALALVILSNPDDRLEPEGQENCRP
jgi:ABC-type nitrate/sulfonate/bicarbonate transport system ATPase subunit